MIYGDTIDVTLQDCNSSSSLRTLSEFSMRAIDCPERRGSEATRRERRLSTTLEHSFKVVMYSWIWIIKWAKIGIAGPTYYCLGQQFYEVAGNTGYRMIVEGESQLKREQSKQELAEEKHAEEEWHKVLLQHCFDGSEGDDLELEW